MKAKKFSAALLCIVLILLFLPTVAFAANAATVAIGDSVLGADSPYYHNGENGSQGYANNVSINANASLDLSSPTPTLTLNGLNIVTDKAIAMSIDGDITIILNGKNTVTSSYLGDDSVSCGLSCRGALTVSGSGSLSVTGGSSLSHFLCFGISAEAITLNSGTFEGVAGSASSFSVGIKGNGGVTVNGGTLIGTGGAGTTNSFGIDYDGSKSSAHITINGGHVIAGSKVPEGVGFEKIVKVTEEYWSRESASSAFSNSPADVSAVERPYNYCEIIIGDYVEVDGGTGSGPYDRGAPVTITANQPETGKRFMKWEISPAVTFTDGCATTETLTFEMPVGDVSAVALYEDIPASPYIGKNGNWFIGTADTGIKAAGTNGYNGRSGSDGSDGKNGADGKNGVNGRDGTGISSIEKTGGEGVTDVYTIKLTDGRTTDFTVTNGENGVGISSVKINNVGELIVILSDGSELNAGSVRETASVSAPVTEYTYGELILPGFIISVLSLICSAGWMLTLAKRH